MDQTVRLIFLSKEMPILQQNVLVLPFGQTGTYLWVTGIHIQGSWNSSKKHMDGVYGLTASCKTGGFWSCA
jgi:hypothetical protein